MHRNKKWNELTEPEFSSDTINKEILVKIQMEER